MYLFFGFHYAKRVRENAQLRAVLAQYGIRNPGASSNPMQQFNNSEPVPRWVAAQSAQQSIYQQPSNFSTPTITPSFIPSSTPPQLPPNFSPPKPHPNFPPAQLPPPNIPITGTSSQPPTSFAPHPPAPVVAGPSGPADADPGLTPLN